MSKTIDPLRALVQTAQQQSDSFISLSRLLQATEIIISNRTSLPDVANHLFNKVNAHPHECINHAQAIIELRKLSADIAMHITAIADSYEKLHNNAGTL